MSLNAERIADMWLKIPFQNLVAASRHDLHCYAVSQALVFAIDALELIDRLGGRDCTGVEARSVAISALDKIRNIDCKL